MKITLTRSFYIPKNAVEISDSQSSARAYLVVESTPWKTLAVGFSGKRNNPDFRFLYRDEAQARQKINAHADGVRRTEAARIERAAARQADKCHTPLDVWNKVRAGGPNGSGISAAETAICLRAALAAAFPAIKFSVIWQEEMAA